MKTSVLLPTNENLIRTLKEDSLERNKDLNCFCKLLCQKESMKSIAIDGRWGSGKTFFVKYCTLLLNAKNSLSKLDEKTQKMVLEAATESENIDGLHDNKSLAIYFDAWENDNEEDPVLSLIYQIIKHLGFNENLKNKDIMSLLLSISDAFSGKSVSIFYEKIRNMDFLNEIRDIEEVNSKITRFFEEVIFEKAEHLVVFVDELDRCRPSYAIKLLERIEHYFVNDQITFVFSVNLEQLQHTIKNFYGNDFDACRYLDRFFDLRISLPPVNTAKLYSSLHYCTYVEIDKVLMKIHQTFNLSIREFYKLNDLVNVSGKNSLFYETEDFMFKYIVTLCLALKITNVSLHDEFVQGKNKQPLLDLYTNDLGEHMIYQLRNGMDSSRNGKIINYITIKQDLSELYDAIFVKNYTSYNNQTVIGEMHFTKESKKFILKVESTLSEYSQYE